MSEESKSRNKSRTSRSKSSKSGSSKSYSSRSGSSSSNSLLSNNSKENSQDKKLVDGFISSLFEEKEEKEEVPNQSEENENSVFVPSLYDNESINKEDGKAVNNFVDSLFNVEKTKKKITKTEPKKGKPKPAIKGQKNVSNNRNNNNKLFSKTKKTNTKKSNKNYNFTSQNMGIIGKRNVRSDLGANNTTNFSQHKRMKTVENNNIKINPKLKDTKSKNSKEITPPNTVVKKERKNHSAQKRIIDRNDNNLRHAKHLNRTLDFQNTELSEEYKAKLESDKEKKEYEERIRLMKNHISAMKRQQEDMNKKINFLKHKEANINNVKKEREKAKKAIMEYNITKKNELEEKRKQIEKQREAMNKQIKESSEKSKMEKINKYKQSQKEKLEVNNKINNNNKNKNNKIISKIEKIKALRENNKNIALNRKKKLNKNYKELNEKKYEKNVEKTNMYKMEIKQLQDEEEDLINQLNQTRERLNTFNSTENIYFGVKKGRKESGNI